MINFNSFFRQALELLPAADPQRQVTASITRLALDLDGKPLTGEEEELSPSQGGRVSVSADGELQQFYVRIGDAAVTDSGVYTIEVCSERDIPGEVCVNASVTVFVLDGRFVAFFFVMFNNTGHSTLYNAAPVPTQATDETGIPTDTPTGPTDVFTGPTTVPTGPTSASTATTGATTGPTAAPTGPTSAPTGPTDAFTGQTTDIGDDTAGPVTDDLSTGPTIATGVVTDAPGMLSKSPGWAHSMFLVFQ